VGWWGDREEKKSEGYQPALRPLRTHKIFLEGQKRRRKRDIRGTPPALLPGRTRSKKGPSRKKILGNVKGPEDFEKDCAEGWLPKKLSSLGSRWRGSYNPGKGGFKTW